MRQVWERAPEEARYWQTILVSLDQAIRRVLQEHPEVEERATVLPHRWDNVDRLVIFPSPRGEGVWNSVHLMVLGEVRHYFVRFSCSAWRDVPSTETPGELTRYWCHNTETAGRGWSLSVPEVVSEDFESREAFAFQDRVADGMRAVLEAVSSWAWNPSNLAWEGQGLEAGLWAVLPTLPGRGRGRL